MTTTRALAVAAYVAAAAAPASADWRSVADMLHAVLPAVRGAALKPADAPAGAAPRWYADWKLGKVYSLDSVAVTFADGVTVRCNLAKAPGKLPRIASACRVAVAFYRARTGNDSVPAFASIVTVSDGAEFDAVACSGLTVDLRRTAYVAPAVRPAVTAEAVSRAEIELARRVAGLMRFANREGDSSAWLAAVRGAEAELTRMRAALDSAVTVAPCEPEAAPCEPVTVMPDHIAEPVTVAACEPCEAGNDDAPVPPSAGPAAAVAPLDAVHADHIEPLAICPAVGMPCKVDCGFRASCTPRTPLVEIAALTPPEGIQSADPLDAIESEPLAALCSDDDAPAVRRRGRKPRAVRTPVEAIALRTPLRAILRDVAPLSWVHPIIPGRARPPVVLHAASTL